MNRQKSFIEDSAKLYIVATPIGNLTEMTYRAVSTLKQVEYIAAEDTRNTIKLLNHFDINTKMISHHEHNYKVSIKKIISLLLEGNSVAVVSDAGFPAISDPGYELVKEAIENNIPVIPISGANACLDALVVSGICPQPFLFYGFLDHKKKNKKKELESLAKYKETIVLYEAPHRIMSTLELLYIYFGNRHIALCRELTKKHEEIIRGTIQEVLNIIDTIKGEIVIVIEGAKETIIQESFDITITEHVDTYIHEGYSTKDAIKKVADIRNKNKNDIYNTYHKK